MFSKLVIAASAFVAIVYGACDTGDNCPEVKPLWGAWTKKMSWYKDWTVNIKQTPYDELELETPYDAFERVPKPSKRGKKKPFRMFVSGVYKNKAVGFVVAGRVEQGALGLNQVVGFAPSGIEGTVFRIEKGHKQVMRAQEGDDVFVTVKNPEFNLPRAGDVMYSSTMKDKEFKMQNKQLKINREKVEVKVKGLPEDNRPKAGAGRRLAKLEDRRRAGCDGTKNQGDGGDALCRRRKDPETDGNGN